MTVSPYASQPIAMSLSSITGLRYRTLHCAECGRPFLERSGMSLYRIGDRTQPDEVKVKNGQVNAMCSACAQLYTVTVSDDVKQQAGSIPLYMQPQAIFVSISPEKKLRNVHCVECGKTFYSISDRVSMLVDNIVPNELLDPARLGPMEAWCKFQYCKQRWSIMV